MAKKKDNFLKKPKAILFDWDNTLIHSLDLIHLAFSETLVQMGKKPYSLQEVKYRVHRSMREEFPELFGDDWQKAAEIYQNEIKKNAKTVQYIDGAKEVLDFLRKEDIYLAVVSNKNGPLLKKEIKELGWEKYFDHVVGAGDAQFDKPSHHPVMMSLEFSDLNPEKDHIWFIGDSITDMECALNSKCRSILYGEHDLESEIFKNSFHGIMPDEIVVNHQDFLELLKKYFVFSE